MGQSSPVPANEKPKTSTTHYLTKKKVNYLSLVGPQTHLS